MWWAFRAFDKNACAAGDSSGARLSFFFGVGREMHASMSRYDAHTAFLVAHAEL